MKEPSKERGCAGKANLGSDYKKYSERLALSHNKTYGVYDCPHCEGYHVTTKIGNSEKYKPLLYITMNDEEKEAIR